MSKIKLVILSSFLFLFFTSNLFSQKQIIASGEEWQYYDKGYLDNNWFLNLDDTKNWKTGITPIGYGDRKITTQISFGSDKDNKHLSKYFKKTVNISNPSEYLAYGFQLKRDDGIIIYLNGKEVFRNNLPLGTITSKTLAIDLIDGKSESEIIFTALDTKDFLIGKNTISVSIHQASESSSDCIFDFEMFAYKNPRILSELINSKSLKNKELESQIKNLNTSILIEKSALKLEMQETRVDSLRFILFITGVLLITALGIVVFLLVTFRRKDQKLNDQIDYLKSDIRDKEHELMSINTKLLHNKQYFKEIKADIKGLKNTNDSIIKDITYHINLALESDEDWANFQKHFSAVYSGFYDVLLKKYPSLTEVELRHCMFIKLHMQTKEIAKILLIDPRSVQTARYRIKKKMDLSEETDLRAYLLSIS